MVWRAEDYFTEEEIMIDGKRYRQFTCVFCEWQFDTKRVRSHRKWDGVMGPTAQQCMEHHLMAWHKRSILPISQWFV